VKGFEHLQYISLPLAARILGRSHIWAWRQARYGKFGPLVRIRKAKHPYVGLLELEKRFGPFSDEQIVEAMITVYRDDDRGEYCRAMMRREEEWKKFCIEKFGYNGPSWPTGPTLAENVVGRNDLASVCRANLEVGPNRRHVADFQQCVVRTEGQ
jgi:hypothetical protein